MNELTVLALIIGPTFIVGGLLLYYFPPKNINSLYGYRTASCMKNQERWDFAQVFAGKTMVWTGALFSGIIYLFSFFSFSEAQNISIGIGLLLLMSILLIVIVEKKLKQKFK